MNDIECPYCEQPLDIDHDDGYGFEEGEIYTLDCKYCEQTFVYSTSIIYLYEGRKAPCLNGGEHVMEIVYHASMQWPNWKRCTVCGEETGKYE